MKHLSQTESRQEAGFTLVELAVVMVIIGLLIGGILKGQELIANAQVTATIAQIKGFDAGITTFKDKYGQLPGDIQNPGGRLSGCSAAPCNDGGNGDGRVSTNPFAAMTTTQEGYTAFIQLAAAGLIQGVQVTGGGQRFGEQIPAAKAGGGFRLGYDNNGNTVVGSNFRPGHLLVMSAARTAAITAADSNGAVPGSQAAQIDRKLDDGRPSTGSVEANGANCRNGANYEETDQGLCHVGIQVQG
ncbi:MAG: prepilin-type N-terminal cleavage/methylation domain-containing protein [Alphaproteobacteria bacterium]|nr:prepilin-type N-terminal cleavage/methylation domain-containing protein [Alphaproteobacteria bacterium]